MALSTIVVLPILSAFPDFGDEFAALLSNPMANTPQAEDPASAAQEHDSVERLCYHDKGNCCLHYHSICDYRWTWIYTKY